MLPAAESPAAAAAAAARKVAFLVASNATSAEIAAAAAAASAAAEVAAAAAAAAAAATTAATRGTPNGVASPTTKFKAVDRRDANHEAAGKACTMDQLKLRHVEALEQIQRLHAKLQNCVEAQKYAEAGRLQVRVPQNVSNGGAAASS